MRYLNGLATGVRPAALLRRCASVTAHGLALLSLLRGAPAAAQLDQTLLRAADGTAYQVLRVLGAGGGGAEALRVTTVAGSLAGGASCAASGDLSGQPASAIGGTLQPGTLHPYAGVRRTFVLAPNAIDTLGFDPQDGGRVTLGTGAAALTVCKSFADCAAADNPQPLVGLDSNAGNLPAACAAAALNAACDGANLRDAFAFGLPASGSPPVCASPAATTVNSTVCAGAPPDGFDLAVGQALVFVYDDPSLATSGFAVAVGGFAITTDALNPFGCAADTIVGAVAENFVDEQLPVPTPTATPIVEPTRPAVPLIASPASPAGLALAALLVAALLLALQRAEMRRG